MEVCCSAAQHSYTKQAQRSFRSAARYESRGLHSDKSTEGDVYPIAIT